MTESTTAAYRPIGAVVALLQRAYPDVSHSSLRFLEREGLVRSTRTPGGHRVYAEADIERIRRIKAWQAEHLSLDEIRHRLDRLDRLPATADLADEFVRLVLGGDLEGARRTILQFDDVGLSLGRLFDGVLIPALEEVGKRWENGTLRVAQEKEISELSRELIAELSRRHARPAATGPLVVAACVAGEDHELGLRMTCGLLREHGARVHYLGADVAPSFLIEAVQIHEPDAVLLSATLVERLPAIRAAVDAVRSSTPPDHRPAIIVGGPAAAVDCDEVRSRGAVVIQNARPDATHRAILAVLRAGGALDD
jgi:DNA-binding transcriptional MerR regulator